MEGWVLPSAAEAREMREAEQMIEAARAAEAAAAAEAERRGRERIAFQARITVSSETNFFVSFSENLSSGGVFIATFSPPAVGSRIWMQVVVEEHGEMMVEGTVRWHRTDESGLATGCGVQFASLDADAHQTLTGMLQSARREPLLADV